MGSFDNIMRKKGASASSISDDISPDVQRAVDNIEEDEYVVNEEEQKEIEEELKEELNDGGSSETKREGDEDKEEEEIPDLGDYERVKKDVEDRINGDLGNDGKKYGVLISGDMLLSVTDAIIPRGIVAVRKVLKIKGDKKVSDLVLTEDERKVLGPLADKVVEELFEKFSPMQQFALVLAAIYGSKV